MHTSNIEISRRDIFFPSNLSCLLDITNNHPTETLFFKIKTTKLKTYDVKPPIGAIPAKQKKTIEFKMIYKMVPFM